MVNWFHSALWIIAALILPPATALADTPNGEASPRTSRALKSTEVSLDNVKPLPNSPIQRFHIDRNGGRVIDGGTAGASGELVYSNTTGPFLYPPGAGVEIADDITTICAAFDLTFVEIAVAGGGDGTGPGFSVDFQLYADCPGDGGNTIPGTQQHAELPDDGMWVVSLDLDISPVHHTGTVWLGVSFSTNSAGWTVGAPSELGISDDIFDGPFPCTTFFGGWPPNPHASFFAQLRGIACLTQYLAYEANSFSGFFNGIEADQRIADDILPVSAPDLCTLTRYDVNLAGTEGPYTMYTEIYSNSFDNRPLSPVLGTQCVFSGFGHGFLETANCAMETFVGIPTAKMWLVYDLDGNPAGPIMNAAFPQIGQSEDCYSFFGQPDAGMFSQCVWDFGGCPLDITGNACGIFQARIYCAGTEPTGACCVTAPGDFSCTDNTFETQCNGHFIQSATCAPDPFDPPCGTAACCLPDETCEDLLETTCNTVDGLWQPGRFCGIGNQACPRVECITATQRCSAINMQQGGCTDVGCCEAVCNIDNFCCFTAWDDQCVALADAFCPVALPDECASAREIPCGGGDSIDNSLATTSVTDPGFSCNTLGPGEQGFGSVWVKFVAMTSQVSIATCNSFFPANDTLLAVYSGTCDNLTELGCSDDSPYCLPLENRSRVLLQNLTIGEVYYVQLASSTAMTQGLLGFDIGCGLPGSCCRGMNECTPSEPTDCTDGVWLPGDPCQPNQCTPIGSCCDSRGCSITMASGCPSGVWTQGGNCTPNICPVEGSCCDSAGACNITLQAQCTSGTWNIAGQCSPNTCPQPPSVMAVGSRYFAVTPDVNQALPVALRVTSQDFACVDQYVRESGLLSHLSLDQTPQQWGTVYVADVEIAPDSTYVILAEGSQITAPITATTWHFGDTNNDSTINLDDILCELAAFSGNYTPTCTLYSADQIGGFFNPDRVVNLDDILAVLNAFAGQPYPGPYPCP